MLFNLKFNQDKISYWTNRYSYKPQLESKLRFKIGAAVRRHGYFTKEELQELCHWKAPRSAGHCKKNEADYVKVVTKAALSSPNERFRIQALTLLDGVNWPTASVILHFGSNDPYPVLDFRALESLGVTPPSPYTFCFWWAYT